MGSSPSSAPHWSWKRRQVSESLIPQPRLAVRSLAGMGVGWVGSSASPAPVNSEVIPFPFLTVPAVNLK